MKKLALSLGILGIIFFSIMILRAVNTPDPEATKQAQEQDEGDRKLLEKAESLFISQNYDTAITIYKEVISSFQKYSSKMLGISIRKGTYADKAQFRIGDCFMEKKDYRMARTAYLLFMSNNPASRYVPDAYYRIGESFIREGNEKGALEPYINAFNNYPEHPEGEKTLFWIANYCFKIKDYQEALYYYHKLKDWFGDAEFADQAYYQIALIHYYRQEYGQTRKYLAGLFRRFPVSPMVPKAYLLLGDSYTEYPDFPLKEKAYNDVLKRDPLSRDAFFRLGEMYRNLRLMDKAVGQYRQVIKPVFDDPYKKYHISHDPLVDSARYEVSQPDSLIRLDSLWQKSQLRIAECLLEKGDKTMALQGLEVFIQLDISDENRWEAYRLYADYYYNKGDYKQALRFFQQLPDGYSMPFRSLYFKGMAYIKAEQYHKAVEVLKNLLSQWEKVPDPKQATFNHDLATFALADALFKEKRYLEAVNHYRQLVAGDDDYVLYRISECYRYLNLRKEAGEVLKKLLAKYPNKYYDIQQERAQVDTTWQDSYMSYLAKIVGHSPF